MLHAMRHVRQIILGNVGKLNAFIALFLYDMSVRSFIFASRTGLIPIYFAGVAEVAVAVALIPSSFFN